MPGWGLRSVLHVAGVAMGLLVATLAPAGEPAGWTSCDFGDVRIEADFPAARADGCSRVSADGVAVLVMPEAAPINPSPWYAFRVISEKKRHLRATLVYGTSKHRYWPKVSEDGVTWRRLAEDAVTVADDGRTATLKLDVGPQPLWVAGQEIWPSAQHQAWLDGWRGRPGITVSQLGWSLQRRPIGMLQTDVGEARPHTVVLVGRQHPPEVSGAFAFTSFVETVLDNSELSRRFRATHRVVAIPELNPDGVQMGYWRQSAGGVDLNRDWGPFAQPETRLMRDLLAAIDADPDTRLSVFLDFHSTQRDVFYTQEDEEPVTPPLFEKRWLARLQERMPDYAVNRKAGHQAGYPTAKTWVFETYRVPSVTFEIGDETRRELIARLGAEAARAMMETLLGDSAPPAAPAAGAMNAGDGTFTFDGWTGPPIEVWYHRPGVVAADTPVLVVMHGVQRDADRYRDQWSALARERGFILVVPGFDARQFPGAAAYNLGNVFDGQGNPLPRDQWAFSALEPLFDTVRQMTGTQVSTYDLYGHSAGAQFVHRYLMYVPEARVGRAIAANAGWYTMPDPGVAFPYGLAGSGVDDAALRRALQHPLAVLLGTADNDPQDESLRRTPEAQAQGPHRLARGGSFVDAGRRAAAERGIGFGWTLQHVEGVAHDNAGMAGPAADLLYESR